MSVNHCQPYLVFCKALFWGHCYFLYQCHLSDFQWKWNKCLQTILYYIASLHLHQVLSNYNSILTLSKRVTDKRLQFNATKCRQMFTSRKQTHSLSPPSLYIDGTALLQVSEYKYLGLVITSDLSWRPRITNMYNKARKLIGLLYRHFYQSSNSTTLLKLYSIFVIPCLEYSSAALT